MLSHPLVLPIWPKHGNPNIMATPLGKILVFLSLQHHKNLGNLQSLVRLAVKHSYSQINLYTIFCVSPTLLDRVWKGPSSLQISLSFRGEIFGKIPPSQSLVRVLVCFRDILEMGHLISTVVDSVPSRSTLNLPPGDSIIPK